MLILKKILRNGL